MSALVPPELLGLLADDGENALITGRFRDGGEHAVECLGYDCPAVRRRMPQATASSTRLAPVTFRISACPPTR